MPKLINLINKTFGRLVVMKRVLNNRQNQSMWLCLCDCGKEKIIVGNDLRKGHTKSCGCLRKEIITKIMTKHGHNRRGKTTKIYYIWRAMVERCTNTNNKDYKYYGSRGITVCKRWMKFENFLADMGESSMGYQIDRIKNNHGYYKENCRWVTSKNNNRNRRDNRLETLNGKTQCIAAWAEEIGINKNTILWRLNHGWSVEKTLMTPTRKNKKIK